MKRKTEKTYCHLSLEERVEIYSLFKAGETLRDIAKKLDRNVGTISRELKRNKSRCHLPYTPVKAHKNATKKGTLQRSKAPLKEPETYLYVREKLRDEGWSPETISGRLKLDRPHLSICHETIYQYIYGKGKRYKLWKYLPEKKSRRRTKGGRGVRSISSPTRIPGAVSIIKRPPGVEKRKTEGHLETDLMEGPRSDKQVLSVEIFRKTRYSQLSKLANKKASTKQKTIIKKLKRLEFLQKSNKPILKSITADGGPENTNHKQISKNLGIKFYFCQPYHSWEKGSVENTIKRIRRFIPKGTPLSQFTDMQIQWLENKLNNTPMKCLKYLTPNEAFEREVNSYKFKKYQRQKEASVALQLRM